MFSKTKDGKLYKFYPDGGENEWLQNINIVDVVSENDLFKSYDAVTTISGTYTICEDVSKLKSTAGRQMFVETYDGVSVSNTVVATSIRTLPIPLQLV